MIAKLLDTLTGASVKRAVDENSKTAADLKDAVEKARAKVDAHLEAERKATHAAGG